MGLLKSLTDPMATNKLQTMKVDYLKKKMSKNLEKKIISVQCRCSVRQGIKKAVFGPYSKSFFSLLITTNKATFSCPVNREVIPSKDVGVG